MAVFGLQAPDDRSIVGRQSFITLSVDRLELDTRQKDQMDFFYGVSTDRQWPSNNCYWLSFERQYLNDPIVGRLSVNKSTDSRSIVGWESTDATYNTHDQADISDFRRWWRALKESLPLCLHCAPLLLFTNGFFIVWCFASPSKGKTGLLSDRVIKRSNYWRELFVDNGLIFS